MKYQVPQFIEVEDKIFGPFTFRQFVYMVGSLGICFIAYRTLPFILALLIMIPAGGMGAALAFYRPNKRPFIETVEAAFNFMLTSKLYIWKKEEKKAEPKSAEDIIKAAKSSIVVPRLSESKLKDLSWSLDINETVYSRETGKLEGRREAQSKSPF